MEHTIGYREEESGCEPHPNSLIMACRFAAFGLGILVALSGMLKEGKYKHLTSWLGIWALFLSWPRYLICSRCDGYGKNCYPYYLGKYTSLIYPRVEGKQVGRAAAALEGVCLSGIFWTPVLALRHNRELLMRYLLIMQLVLAGQFFHACRWCAANSRSEWKKDCPAYRAWKMLQG
ncbi:MAG: hypothetical protein SWK76_06490 [Actinomycetota bacterium]|nr:hypothetical protein [Actinomycetota bacterium]